MNRFRSKLWVSLISLSTLLTSPSSALAQTDWESNPSVSGCSVDGVATLRGLGCIVTNLLNIAIQTIGVALLVMLIIGGFRILTGGSDPQKVEAGKKTITYAIVGLTIAVLAWFILQTIEQITGAPVTQFKLPDIMGNST